jgi:hypothetical protein
MPSNKNLQFVKVTNAPSLYRYLCKLFFYRSSALKKKPGKHSFAVHGKCPAAQHPVRPKIPG